MSSEADVLAEIARLSSAIDQHKQHAHSPRGRGRGRGRGAYRGRGRGGGGGGPVVAAHRNQTWVAPHLPQPSPNPTPGPSSRSGTATPIERSSEPPSSNLARRERAPRPPPREVSIGGVVFVADSRGNKLVRKPGALASSVGTNGEATAPTTTDSPVVEADSTPRRTSHLGTTYIRTKSGNLVSLAFARDRKVKNDALKAKRERLEKLGEIIGGVQGARNRSAAARGKGSRGRGRGGFHRSNRVAKPPKPKSDKLCIFFQKTGQCSRAHTCRYVHDSTKISICPQFLRSSCPRTASTCPLSHHPNSHRSPHCSHFPSCTRPQCPYAHVVVATDAKVCRDFVEYGWCDLGDKCDRRHVRECWRFSETGKCDVVGCKEPHVLRRVHSQESEDEDVDRSTTDDDQSDDDSEREGDEDDQEELRHGIEDELNREEKGIKRKRATAGISGEAGRRLTKKLRNTGSSRGRGGLQDQDDFVQLTIPSSDLEEEDEDEEEEDDEGMSVDSDDLADDDDQDDNVLGDKAEPQAAEPRASSSAIPNTTRTLAATAPAATNVTASSHIAPPPQKNVKRRHQDEPPARFDDQIDELDYGLSSSDHDDDDEDDDAARGGQADETIYLEASEGLDLDDDERQRQREQEPGTIAYDDESDDDDDKDVANLLRR